jgi:hypothetical protein
MNVNREFIKTGMLVLSGLLLVGCSRMPLSTLWAMRSFDVKQLDGAALRLIVYLPDQIDTLRDGVKVHVKAERGNAAAEVLEETLVLRPVVGIPAQHALPRPRAGGHWTVLGLDTEEQARLAALRQTMAAWKAQDGEGVKRRLGTAVSPQLCAQRPGVRAADVSLNAWLRWRPGQDDLLLLDGATGADLDDKAAQALLPTCL